MNPKRVRLVNAARKALFQRTQVQRSAGAARDNFTPAALKQRATRKIIRRVDGAVDSAERGLRRFAVPLGLAAVAGLAFAFRRPLADATNAIADTLSAAASAVTGHLAALRDDTSPSLADDKDEHNEPV